MGCYHKWDCHQPFQNYIFNSIVNVIGIFLKFYCTDKCTLSLPKCRLSLSPYSQYSHNWPQHIFWILANSKLPFGIIIGFSPGRIILLGVQRFLWYGLSLCAIIPCQVNIWRQPWCILSHATRALDPESYTLAFWIPFCQQVWKPQDERAPSKYQELQRGEILSLSMSLIFPVRSSNIKIFSNFRIQPSCLIILNIASSILKEIREPKNAYWWVLEWHQVTRVITDHRGNGLSPWWYYTENPIWLYRRKVTCLKEEL